MAESVVLESTEESELTALNELLVDVNEVLIVECFVIRQIC